MTQYSNAYILLDNEDGEVIVRAFTKNETEAMMREVSQLICFSDCDDTFSIVSVVYHGREVRYGGWLPDNIVQFYFTETGDLAWENQFPQWNH